VLLKKTGNGLTGIIASGTVISAPYLNGHWGKGKDRILKQYVLVRFDHLADYTKGEVMPVNDKADFGFVPQASGCVLDEDKAASLLGRFHAYAAAPVVTPVVLDPAGKKRVAIGARLRWSILDRDFHTCHYCGRSAPIVVLHVDHKISQVQWREQQGNLEGVNDPSNLVTSCSDCNLGKGADNARA
jgi:5-methylcytosine-specific restriction endonuclease McrA